MGPKKQPDVRETVAILILKIFESYLAEFLIITKRAKIRFEERDWRGARRDASERLSLYEKVLSQASIQIEGLLGERAKNRQMWKSIKPIYAGLIAGRSNEDIAETFFNSVTRKLLQTVGLDREVEFFYLQARPLASDHGSPIFKRYKQELRTKELIGRILRDHAFNAAYEGLDRDLDLVASEVDLHLWPLMRDGKDYSIEIVTPSFYRNKVAYIVGRIILGSRIIPIILPLSHGEHGVRIDSVLMQEADASNIFGFAYSYFQVEIETPSELVAFLSSILPHKPLSDLYNAIGFYKHGKTEFYRDLHRFVHLSKEQFVIAPGIEGAVMIVFTLPHYNYVFKIMKDTPCFLRTNRRTDKVIDKSEVRSRYRFVCNRDRVGRLVDTQEFENVRFRTKRYTKELLNEFNAASARTRRHS